MPHTLCEAQRSSRVPFSQHEVCERVLAEFREMPGLKLTLPQASRLFDLDPLQCEQVLAALVDSGHLATDGKVFGRYLR
jgi:hypothetical protein